MLIARIASQAKPMISEIRSYAFGVVHCTACTFGPTAVNYIWFAENASQKIGRITLAGKVTEFSLPAGTDGPYDLASGEDGNLWFTRPDDDQVGFIDATGAVTQFNLPTTASQPHGIASGPDCNIWVAETIGKIGRIQVPPLPTSHCLHATPLVPTATPISATLTPAAVAGQSFQLFAPFIVK